MAEKVYSFLDCHCSFVGPTGAFSLIGSAAQEGISVTFNEDNVKTTWGADGKYVHSLVAQKGSDISVKLLKNSTVNALLSASYNLQKTSSILTGQNTITITSSLGDTLILTGVAFKKAPMVQFGMEAQLLDWALVAGETNFTLGSSI